MRVSSTKRPQRRVSSAIPIDVTKIFATLLVLNFIIFVINVWIFFPAPAGNSLSAQVSKKSRKKKPHIPDPSAEALRQALYSSSNKIVPYDIVPKILHQSDSFRGVVHQLPSIPRRRRMVPNTSPQDGDPFVPQDAVDNLNYFLESRVNEIEEHQPLFLYNPMLLPLDDEILDSIILDDLSVDQNRAAYLSVYRVSNFGNCHGPGKGVPKTYANFLGLALLDQELNVVTDPVSGQYLDAVIDINKHLWEVKWKPPRRKRADSVPLTPVQYMQDCQIFPARSNERQKSSQLILLCNEFAMPIKLKLKRLPSSTLPDQGQFMSFTNKYGTELQLSAQEKPNLIMRKGKNMHYFSTDSQSYLEIWPGGPHEVVSIDFMKYPYVDGYFGIYNIEQTKALASEPEATFQTKTEVEFFKNRSMLIDRDSGSTCCVKIKWKANGSEEERELLLGFSHRKTRKVPKRYIYTYVSRIYAFEPNPPFNIVARSGYFCLGFATDHEKEVSQNEQVRGAANNQKMKLWTQTFEECPRIHFVTGITEKYDDDETVIVSYGVNDCYPRMIEISKEFLVSLLKPIY